jgi:hypothetical protein
MSEEIQPSKDRWRERQRAAGDFWPGFVYAARGVYGQMFDPGDKMRTAINERFDGLDKAISRALETGCVYFKYRGPTKHPEVTILTFSDGKGKSFQHSVKMDERFAPEGRELDFHDFWWFRAALAGLIVSEGKVKQDPRGGWIPDAIIDNADKLRTAFETDRRTGKVSLIVSVESKKS